jgi:hypothetical protein
MKVNIVLVSLIVIIGMFILNIKSPKTEIIIKKSIN